MSKVRKRESARGGSARPEFVQQRKQNCCFPLLNFFRLFCPPNDNLLTPESQSVMSSLSSSHNHSDKSVKLPTTEERKKWLQSDKGSQSMTSYTTSTNANKKKLLFHSSSMITYGTKNVSYFALKSILLDRCACDKLKDELRNEGT